MLQYLIAFCRFNFGTFENEEFKKFLRMGLIFAIIIGVYWTLRPLKDSIFIQFVDKMHLPYAKTISLLGLLPLIIFYTKLLEYVSRERMLIILPLIYGVTALIFSIGMFFIQPTLLSTTYRSIPIQILGYIWYLFVESFGSLIIALFWAFSADTTNPASAKKGFPLVTAIGQIGGIICPYSIGGLPHRLGFITDGFSILILALLTLSIIPLMNYFIRVTPTALLVSFDGINEKKEEVKTGFLEGLRLIIAHKYLLGIVAVTFIYELIITVFDFNFKVSASTHYTGVALSHYLSMYGSSVNIVSLFCLLFGVSNITRFLGIGIALALMPVIFCGALICFLTLDNLSFLFWLMVSSKGINYALNGPALKQLYIPTSKNVRFKAQAWIETFGARSSKETGSIFNMLLGPLQNAFGEVVGKSYYLMVIGILGFPLFILWFIIAIYLGRNFRLAVDEKKVIC